MTLAKGLTGAHLPLGAVVLSAEVAERLEHERLQTGLTYCGHPLSCAAGLAALQAYEDEGLVERSRDLGGRMLACLRSMQDRLPVVGDVRGGHGLFAVVELVKDRATREPVSAWPATHPSLERLVRLGREEGVSFAVRGNLVDPGAASRHPGRGPLERARAPRAASFGPGVVMSFKLTYSTMFDPPEEMHLRFEKALAQVRSGLGATHAMHVGGRDVAADSLYEKRSPVDDRLVLGRFALGDAKDADRAMAAAKDAFPRWRSLAPAERVRLVRRVAALLEERVYSIGAALALEVGKNRMEALGETQETADFFTGYAADYERNDFFDRALPDDPLAGFRSHNRSVLKPHGVWVVITPFNFPLALAGGPVAAALVTGNTVVLKGATDTPWAGRLLADCIRDAGFPPGVFNYVTGPGRVVGEALVRHADLAGVTFTGSHEVGMALYRAMAAGAHPRPCIAEMGGKNACVVTAHGDLERAATGIVRSAFGLTGQKCSALSRVYVQDAVADELLAKLLQKTAAIRVGDPCLRENWMGPVVNAGAAEGFERCVARLRADGGRILAGGVRIRDGEPRPRPLRGPDDRRSPGRAPALPGGDVPADPHGGARGGPAGGRRPDERQRPRPHRRLLRQRRRRAVLPRPRRGRRHVREPAPGGDDRRLARLPGLRGLEGLGLDRQGDRLLLLPAALPARAVPDRRGVSAAPKGKP